MNTVSVTKIPPPLIVTLAPGEKFSPVTVITESIASWYRYEGEIAVTIGSVISGITLTDTGIIMVGLSGSSLAKVMLALSEPVADGV